MPNNPPAPDDLLIPTTREIAQDCPRFRVLLVGRSGVGKSSLINEVFKAPLAAVEELQAGAASISTEIKSPHNEYFVAHDSEGYQPGDASKFNVLKNFITERSQMQNFSDRLHAIWLCIATPFANGRIFETGDEEICNLKQLGVPVIIVFTKYDLLLTAARRELMNSGSANNGDILMKKTHDLAKKRFDDICTPALKHLAKYVPGRIPYVCVSTRYPETLQKLVKMTLKNIGLPKQPQQSKPFMRRFSNTISRSNSVGILEEDWNIPATEDYSDSRMITLATAQRVDIESKIATSISVGKRKYWNGLATGLYFYNVNLWRCLEVIHTDIVQVWNIRGMSQYFLSDDFRGRMTIIVQGLSDNEQSTHRRGSGNSRTLADLLSNVAGAAIAAGPAAVVIAPMAAAVAVATWVYGVYKES